MEKQLTFVSSIKFTDDLKIDTYKDVDGNKVTFVYDESNRLILKVYENFYNTIYKYENGCVSEMNAVDVCTLYNSSLRYKEYSFKQVDDSYSVNEYECLDDMIENNTAIIKIKEKYVTFRNFEINLRFLLNELNEDTVDEDHYLLDDIKHSIVIFAMKEKFNETDETFLENTKREFYDSIDKLETRHPDLKYRTKLIKLFMEQYYFNT